MRKRLLTLVLLAGTLICAPAAARAETLTSERNISFTSDNKLSEDRSAADMNSAVYELQPGDDITITLNLKNDNASAANWYMTNEVLQSLEETAGSGASGGAYEYELTYTDPAGAREVLFTSDTVGGENSSSRVGLKAATSGLEDFLYLDTLSPGQRGVVTLRVALDGETQGNDYQNTLASLQMNFAVDTTTVNNQTVTRVVDENGNPILVDDNGGSHARTGIVRTGDENNLLPYVAAAGVSGLLLLILAIIGIKERKKAEKGMKAMALCLALSLVRGMSVPAQAAEDYTYTLRLFAGAQGTIDASVVQRLSDAGATVSIEDGEVCVVSGLHYGEQVVFDIQRGVALQEGSKYYRKGFRVSGEDTNSNRLANPSVTVNGDADYVVAYGIQGETVAYTVTYQDTEGNELYPSAVYYGNVGDMPVVAYQYIEGWQPQAYNLGKTLVADASQNVFDFIYTRIPTVVTTDTVVVPGQPAEPQEPVVQEPEGVTVVEPEEGPEAPIEPVGDDIEDDETPLAPPDDYRNLDDEETPLGGYDGGEDGPDDDKGIMTSILDDIATPLAVLTTPAKAGILAVLAALAGVGVWLIVAARKKGKKEDEQ
ncbi:hypothetical protein [uncultured Acetatifactor sp.]|uniref:hypothetical protein n=1 Tax=uncultured Acetatifactor sp. TaxID=1671927 RepID=UPI00261A5AEB|nr:hypothetical protein [uncultured Acetatifactor sp.]